MRITRQTTHILRHVPWAAAFAILSLTVGGSVSAATPANNEGLAASEEPKYFIFRWSPEKARELAAEIGMKGDGKTRLLGFGLVPEACCNERR